MEKIEVSVVMPCLNEEQTLEICINKVKEIFRAQNIRGEIIVVDNGSTDRSKEIALKCGVILVSEERRGYGAAYLKGLSYTKGEYIVIGDSDDTYDFLEIPKFLEALDKGYDFVIGSRFKGKIQKGAMTWSHRYIGNPILSGMCRLFFHIRLSDIHCGMRAFKKTAYQKMKLMTLGMEFATEMVLSCLTNNLKICEIPISYHPRKGESKLRSIRDAWRHTRFMLMYCPLWLYFIPGSIGFGMGIFLLLILMRGPFLFLGHRWDIHLMVLASIISILSYQLLHLGVYAHTYAIREGFLRYDRITQFLQKHFNLERGIVMGGIIFLLGLGINFFIFIEWLNRDFGQLFRIRESILAMTFMVIGLQTIFSSFFISLLFVEKNK